FNCLPGWSAYDQHCYQAFNEPKTWDEAERFCTEQAKRGHLVSIGSDGEADFVAQLVTNNIKRPELYVWIGLRDRRKEQQCSSEWSMSASIIYVNWNTGESQMCQGLARWTGFRKWDYSDCQAKNPFVCKFSSEC
uniref:Rhodocetin subunit gamma n=1 Tax=Calloselasma rhodostoma TaxID=8717 RepID=UPI0001BFBC1A|nr:Chain C, Rhodocetin subunit gamma [Calloselasma rhodostoma]